MVKYVCELEEPLFRGIEPWLSPTQDHGTLQSGMNLNDATRLASRKILIEQNITRGQGLHSVYFASWAPVPDD
jgi:hypothetical protein